MYDYGDLIADFGGYLGLLLGASLISLYDMVQTLFQKLYLSILNRAHK